jgi:predicted transcriptional regulator
MRQLKSLRRDSGLTQQKLAIATGLPRWRIAHAELGMIRLSSDELAAIRGVLVTVCSKRTERVLRLAGTKVSDVAVAVSQ